MEKSRYFLFFVIGIFLISFVSAFGGSFGNFDSSTLMYGGVFVILFALVNFILKKTPLGENKSTRVVISFVLAAFGIYGLWGINLDFGSVYLGGFYLGQYLPTILTLIFVAGIIYMFFKFKPGRVFLGIGIFLLALGLLGFFTDFLYNPSILIILGVFFIILGLFLIYRKKKKSKTDLEEGDFSSKKRKKRRKEKPSEENAPSSHKRKKHSGDWFIIRIAIRGKGKTRPRTGTYNVKKGKVHTIKAIGNNFSHWELDSKPVSKNPEAKLKIKGNHTLVAIFGKNEDRREKPSSKRDIKKEEILLKEWEKDKELIYKNKHNGPVLDKVYSEIVRKYHPKKYSGPLKKIAKKILLEAQDLIRTFKKGQKALPPKKERKEREKTASDLKRKYHKLSKEIQKIQKRNKGKIPKLNTRDGKLRHRYLQAMKAIENIAKEKGIKL